MATSVWGFYAMFGCLRFPSASLSFKHFFSCNWKNFAIIKQYEKQEVPEKCWGETVSAKHLIGTARNRNPWLNLGYAFVEGYSGHFTKVCWAGSSAQVPCLWRQSAPLHLDAATVRCSQSPRASEDAKKNNPDFPQEYRTWWDTSAFSSFMLSKASGADTPGNLILIPFLLSLLCTVTPM